MDATTSVMAFKVIGSLIGWTSFLVVLLVLKNFAVKAFAVVCLEILTTPAIDIEMCERIIRWLGNKDEVARMLQEAGNKN